MFRVLNVMGNETGYLVRDDGWRFETSDVHHDYILIPAFFNAHTHLGDSFIEAPSMPLEELVGKDGYKFRKIQETNEREIVEWMKKSIGIIKRTASTSLEFRENGMRGFKLYLMADEEKILTALSRPSSLEEAEILSEISYGFNFSSVRDHDFKLLEECRELAKHEGIVFAIHAGERDGKDVEPALSLEPDFLIHMNMAERRHLMKAMDEGIHIVSCFRSNAFFDLFRKKNYVMLSDYEKWLIGTDNAMISSPSMIDELKFASYFLDSKKLFNAGTRNPFFESYMLIKSEKIHTNENVFASIIRRIESCDVFKVIRESVEFK